MQALHAQGLIARAGYARMQAFLIGGQLAHADYSHMLAVGV
jgi:hypothetical protein